jgi:hypothetical protein
MPTADIAQMKETARNVRRTFMGNPALFFLLLYHKKP